MIFLLTLLYALLLPLITWLLPLFFDSAGPKTAAVLSLLSSAVGLLAAAWSIHVYQPESKKLASSIVRLQGVRAVCLICSIVIGALLVSGEPGHQTLLQAIPICVALLLNAFGLEYWPAILRPDWSPDPTPEPVAPSPVEPEALIIREFKWTYEEIPYSLRLAIRQTVYDGHRSEERILDTQSWPKVYVSEGITGEVRDLATRLSRLGKPFGSYDEVSLALAFVQQIVTYAREEGDYPRYPVETLVDEQGDCEDFSILAASILHCMGYQTALMYVPGHAALGVAGTSGIEGVFKEHNGVRFYYCEMAGEGWQIGHLPDQHDETEITVAPIPSPPLKIVRPSDTVADPLPAA